MAWPSGIPSLKTTRPVITTTRAQWIAKKNAKSRKQTSDESIGFKTYELRCISGVFHSIFMVISLPGFILYKLGYKLKSFFLNVLRERQARREIRKIEAGDGLELDRLPMKASSL